MNAEEVEQLNELIRLIHADFKLTILLIEHHMDMVMAICPHSLHELRGKIAEDLPQRYRATLKY